MIWVSDSLIYLHRYLDTYYNKSTTKTRVQIPVRDVNRTLDLRHSSQGSLSSQTTTPLGRHTKLQIRSFQGFVLHDRTNQPFQVHYNNSERFQNGTDQNHLSYTVINNQQYSQSPPNASPIRRAKTPQRQGSLPEVRRPESVSLQQLQKPQTQAIQDDMEPQNISFIGNAEDDALRQGINRLNISSGTRTYRIPSPTRPSLNRNSFQQMEQEEEDKVEKGFYISFDNEAPKRPKPPLRAKRMSPKKERNPSEYQMEVSL